MDLWVLYNAHVRGICRIFGRASARLFRTVRAFHQLRVFTTWSAGLLFAWNRANLPLEKPAGADPGFES